MSRPELTGHAATFYNSREAQKYDTSSRMRGVQREITLRAIELLKLDDSRPHYILDVGCGSGLSGRVLEEQGYVWVGCDVSRDMLSVAQERMFDCHRGGESKQEGDAMQADDASSDEEEEEQPSQNSRGDCLHHDMGTGLPFRPATFDACISISALQWLCYSNSSQQNPKQRLARFFASLYSVLKRGGRAVLQFYPETAQQAVLIAEAATRAGFSGGVVVDYPNSAKAKKHYLVLSFGQQPKNKKGGHPEPLETALPTKQQHVAVVGGSPSSVPGGRRKDNKKAVVRKKKGVKTKEWILHKKESQRKQGRKVRPDTKFTARRRPHKF